MRRVSILQNTRTSSDRESVAAEITLPGRVATAQRSYGLVHQNGEDGCKCLGIPQGRRHYSERPGLERQGTGRSRGVVVIVSGLCCVLVPYVVKYVAARTLWSRTSFKPSLEVSNIRSEGGCWHRKVDHCDVMNPRSVCLTNAINRRDR